MSNSGSVSRFARRRRSELSSDATFTTPAGHQGVTFVAASGDAGSPGDYPAYSPNVLAVGGTSLYVNSDGSYWYDRVWYDSGNGESIHETEPSFQRAVQNFGSQQIPDVNFADPNTGVAIYISYDLGATTPSTTIGGTSVSAACWAGLVATADQLRVSQGLGTLDGASQTLPGLYALPKADFNIVGATVPPEPPEGAIGLGIPSPTSSSPIWRRSLTSPSHDDSYRRSQPPPPMVGPSA